MRGEKNERLRSEHVERVDTDNSGQEKPEKRKDRLKERAISLLVTEKSVERAARKLNVTSRTLYRWLSDPEFKKSLSEAKAELLRMASTILAANATKAAIVLSEVFSNKKGRLNQSARVSAALWNIRLAHEALELENFEERLSALERQSTNASPY
jgi:transposase-like protein